MQYFFLSELVYVFFSLGSFWFRATFLGCTLLHFSYHCPLLNAFYALFAHFTRTSLFASCNLNEEFIFTGKERIFIITSNEKETTRKKKQFLPCADVSFATFLPPYILSSVHGVMRYFYFTESSVSSLTNNHHFMVAILLWLCALLQIWIKMRTFLSLRFGEDTRERKKNEQLPFFSLFFNTQWEPGNSITMLLSFCLVLKNILYFTIAKCLNQIPKSQTKAQHNVRCLATRETKKKKTEKRE